MRPRAIRSFRNGNLTHIMQFNLSSCQNSQVLTYATFTLGGFDDQEQNLTFVKTAFQVLKLKFLACSLKQALYPLYERNIAQD